MKIPSNLHPPVSEPMIATSRLGNTLETTLILGIGNVALGDEGFGVHVARQMKGIGLPETIKVQEGGVAGFDLLGSFQDIDRIIVVDVTTIDVPPGEIAFFGLNSKLASANKTNLSFHQVGIIELIQIAGLLNRTPKIDFLVTNPQKMEWSFDLSPEVQKAADKAVLFLKEMFSGNYPHNG
jgi:hydrogenase maturation protease